MTTEQMDWLDDERAGRHAPKVLRGHPTEEEIAEARKDAPFGVLIVPEELEPYWVERKGEVDEMEEHTHHTREARDQCEAGDHHYALLLDAAAEREKIAVGLKPDTEYHVRVNGGDETVMTTMAEEPIENRLRRAYENGLKQGLELGHQAFGNWDHR